MRSPSVGGWVHRPPVEWAVRSTVWRSRICGIPAGWTSGEPSTTVHCYTQFLIFLNDWLIIHLNKQVECHVTGHVKALDGSDQCPVINLCHSILYHSIALPIPCLESMPTDGADGFGEPATLHFVQSIQTPHQVADIDMVILCHVNISGRLNGLVKVSDTWQWHVLVN